ncbi:MAG TPA: hypothetical protein VF066_04080, partial [Thermoleophilaceae bacterium]
MDESRKKQSTSSDDRAQKIDPRYAQGELVRVAYTSNQAESDLLQNMLLEEGIPSMVKRTRGFDVPDFLAAGPRDIYVPESGAAVAREFLHEVWEGAVIAPQEPSVISVR